MKSTRFSSGKSGDLYANLITLALISILLVMVGINNWGESFDDAFITYRYAKNLLMGNGFVYNVGERHLGTTTPLFVLLLTFFGFFYSDIPFWGSLLSLISLGLTSFFTYKLLSQCTNYWGGICSIPLVILNPIFISTIGNESNLLIFFLVSQYYFYINDRKKTFAVLSALGILTRGEGILLPIIIFLFEVIKRIKGKKISVTPWLILIILIVPWLIFSKIYFGSFLPYSLKVKILQTRNPRYVVDITFFGDITKNFWKALSINTFSRIILLSVFLYGLGKSLLDRKFIHLTLSIMAFFAGYSLLNIRGYFWYRNQIGFAVCFFLSYGIYSLSIATAGRHPSKLKQHLRDFFSHTIQNIPATHSTLGYKFFMRMAFFTSVFVFLFTAHGIITRYPRMKVYKTTGIWISENTEPKAVFGIAEVGIVGYYSNRKMLDLWGLSSYEMGQMETQNNWIYLIETLKPDYYISQNPAPYMKVKLGMHLNSDNLFRRINFKDHPYVLVKKFGDPVIQVGIWERQKRDGLSGNLLSSEGE